MNFTKMKPWLYSLLICLSTMNSAYSLEETSKETIEKNTPENNDAQLVELNKAFSQHQKLINSGDYQEALIFAERSYQLAKEKLAMTAPQRLMATDNYALNLQMTEDLAKAHSIFKELLSLYEMAYGKHAKELLPILADIGNLEQKLIDVVGKDEAKATAIRRYKLYLRHNSDDFVAQFADKKLPTTQHAINTQKKVSKHFDKSFNLYETDHWSIIYSTDKKKYIKNKMAKLMETTYQNNISFLVALGLRNKPIEEKMTAVIFESKDDYSRYIFAITGDKYAAKNSGGIYVYKAKAIFMFERGENKKGKVLKVNTKTVAHEVSHQVMHKTGLQSLRVIYPRWFTEGLAASFEFNDIKKSFGPHTNNYAFRRVLTLKRSFNEGSLITLKNLVSFDGDDEKLKNKQNQTDVYALGSMLVRFLYQKHPDELKAYLTIIANSRTARYERAKSGKNIRLKQFTKAFGDPDLMQASFTKFTENVIAETDIAYAAYKKRKQEKSEKKKS